MEPTSKAAAYVRVKTEPSDDRRQAGFWVDQDEKPAITIDTGSGAETKVRRDYPILPAVSLKRKFEGAFGRAGSLAAVVVEEEAPERGQGKGDAFPTPPSVASDIACAPNPTSPAYAVSKLSERAILEYLKGVIVQNYTWGKIIRCHKCGSYVDRVSNLSSNADNVLRHTLKHGISQTFRCSLCGHVAKAKSGMASHFKRFHRSCVWELHTSNVMAFHAGIKKIVDECFKKSMVSRNGPETLKPNAKGTLQSERMEQVVAVEFVAEEQIPETPISILEYCKRVLLKIPSLLGPIRCALCGSALARQLSSALCAGDPCPFAALRHVMAHLKKPMFACNRCGVKTKKMRTHLDNAHRLKLGFVSYFTDLTDLHRNDIIALIDKCYRRSDDGTAEETRNCIPPLYDAVPVPLPVTPADSAFKEETAPTQDTGVYSF